MTTRGHGRIFVDQLAERVARGTMSPGVWRKVTAITAVAVIANVAVVYVHYVMQHWFSFVVQFVPLVLPAWWWMRIRSARERQKRETP